MTINAVRAPALALSVPRQHALAYSGAPALRLLVLPLLHIAANQGRGGRLPGECICRPSPRPPLMPARSLSTRPQTILHPSPHRFPCLRTPMRLTWARKVGTTLRRAGPLPRTAASTIPRTDLTPRRRAAICRTGTLCIDDGRTVRGVLYIAARILDRTRETLRRMDL